MMRTLFLWGLLLHACVTGRDLQAGEVPNLDLPVLEFTRLDQNLTLRWIAPTGLLHQVEFSEDLKLWTGVSAFLQGEGKLTSFTHSTAGHERGFHRIRAVNRSLAAGHARFDVATGFLTVVSDDVGHEIIVRRDSQGVLSIARDGVAVFIEGGLPTVLNTRLIQIVGGSGDDRLGVDGSNGAMPSAHLFGGAGNDFLTGGSGDDLLYGGSGNDILLGGGGADQLFGEAGDDVLTGGPGTDLILAGDGEDIIVWNPADESDIIEGQAGNDTLRFVGSNLNEAIRVEASGSGIRVARDVANVTQSCVGIERVEVIPLGGADSITVGDLSFTEVSEVLIDLSAASGQGVGDRSADSVKVFGTPGDDIFLLAGANSNAEVDGLRAVIKITGAEAANDRLFLSALAGDDVVEASGLAANTIQLTANGGSGDDVLIGGEGGDTLQGGDGDDVLMGGPGLDILDGGGGDDVLVQQ